MPGLERPKRPRFSIHLSLPLVVFLGACGDAAPEANADAGLELDASTVDANLACPDPTAVLPTNYRPINTVAETALTDLGNNTVEVDATAGGFGSSGENPFIYLSFDGGALSKVEVTDTESYQSLVWDIALKRTVIRSNSGDSGPGGVTVGEVAAASLAVAEPPSDSSYVIDDFATDDCELNAGQIGEPLTAFADWYEYDQATNRVMPAETVFFVKRASHHVKLRVLDYYRGGDSARYEVEWTVVD